MSVLFKTKGHVYQSIDPNENIDWVSVTKFINQFKVPFDADKQALKSGKNKKSKWYGLKPTEIKELWSTESERSLELGNWYHDQRESDFLAIETIQRKGKDIPIIKPIYNDDIKHAPDQSLTEGVYPEHFVYLKSIGICGQADRVEVVDGFVDIIDYKTNKEIKTESYKSWDGVSKKMLFPVDHLDDCNFNHYALQLSLYMYMILRHNPNLKPGTLTIQHVTFKVKDEVTEYGYPILEKDNDDNYIVQETIPHVIEYRRNDIKNLIKYKESLHGKTI